MDLDSVFVGSVIYRGAGRCSLFVRLRSARSAPRATLELIGYAIIVFASSDLCGVIGNATAVLVC